MTSPLDWIRQAAATREDAGLTRRLTRPTGDGLDLAGNDYLGLRTHPAVVAGAVAAAETYGAGAGASRLVTGTLDIHDELEAALMALAAPVRARPLQDRPTSPDDADAGTLIVSDEHAHASLIDGAASSRAAVSVSRHNDLDHVAELLGRREHRERWWWPSRLLGAQGRRAGRWTSSPSPRRSAPSLVLDEAHALGVLGPGGVVAWSRPPAVGGAEHVVVTATLSKSLAAQGGAVLASPDVREHLVNTARPFIYDTGAGALRRPAALAGLGVLREHPELTGRARERGSARRGLRRPSSRRGRHVGARVRAPRGGGGGRAGRAARHPDRLLPSAVDAGRHLPAEAHGTRRPHRARPRPGVRGARRGHRPSWLTRAR